MVDDRANFSKEMAALLRDTYGKSLNVFGTEIPRSTRAVEATAAGKSIFAYDPRGRVATAYEALTNEILTLERLRNKSRQAER